MAQSSSPEYLETLQAQVASLRRKLVEEKAEQDREQSWTRSAKHEAELLRSQSQEQDQVLRQERNRLAELAKEAVLGRLEIEACRKEVVDRQCQVLSYEAELQQVKEKADKQASAGIQIGVEAIARQERAQLAAVAAQREARRARAEAVDGEVQRLKAELAADVEEAAQQLRRSAMVQLYSALDRCRFSCIAAEEQKRCAAVPGELEEQREEQRRYLETQLEDIEKETVSSRKAITERRRAEHRKADKKRKALLAKIATARREADELDSEAAQQEADRRREEVRAAAKRSAAIATAKADAVAALASLASPEMRQRKLAQALSRQTSALQPMMLANSRGPRGSKAGGMYAEFPILGALQEIDQEISRASAPGLGRVG